MGLRIQPRRTAIQARLGGSAGRTTIHLYEPVLVVALADSRLAAEAVIFTCPDTAVD